jgi:hypothetical protein
MIIERDNSTEKVYSECYVIYDSKSGGCLTKDIRMTNRHVKWHCTTVAIRGLKITTTLRHHYIPFRMAKILNGPHQILVSIWSAKDCHSLLVGMQKWNSHFGSKSGSVLLFFLIQFLLAYINIYYISQRFPLWHLHACLKCVPWWNSPPPLFSLISPPS